MFNATFNNISAISWWSVLFVVEAGVPAAVDYYVLYRLLLQSHLL